MRHPPAFDRVSGLLQNRVSRVADGLPCTGRALAKVVTKGWSTIPTVLVIDDDALVRDMIREVLEGEGYEVSVAEDGVAGSLLFQRMHYDLLITDIVMPNQDGLETILAIHRARPDLPILAISGGGRYAWTDVLGMAALFGASQTLSKPFSGQALVACVHELLRNLEPTLPRKVSPHES